MLKKDLLLVKKSFWFIVKRINDKETKIGPNEKKYALYHFFDKLLMWKWLKTQIFYATSENSWALGHYRPNLAKVTSCVKSVKGKGRQI